MQAVDLVNAEALHQPVIDHGLAAGAAFFGGLENDYRRSGKISRFGQILRRPQQHGRVAVMAAGMHLPGNF